MNIRSLTRGDGVVIGAAVLLFIASFLDFYSAPGVDAPSAWDTDVFHLALPSIFLLAFIAVGLLVTARLQPAGRQLLGLPFQAWGTVLSVAAAWSALWALITCPTGADLGAGAVIGFLATAVLAGVTLFGPKVPALAGQLIPDPKPAVAPVPPYGGQPQQPGAGYGYPGGQEPQPYGAARSRPRPTAAATSSPRPRRTRPRSRPRRRTSLRSGSPFRWPVRSSPRTATPPRSRSSRPAPGTWPWSSAVRPPSSPRPRTAAAAS